MSFQIEQFFKKEIITHNAEFTGIDIVGDVHGCAAELKKLLVTLGYDLESYKHPQNRLFIFLGDLVDRGPKNKECFEIALRMREQGHIWIVGNHDDKFLRYLKGNPVTLSHGADMTAREFAGSKYDSDFASELLDSLPHKVVIETEDSTFYLAHAFPFGWKRDLCMYGPIGENGRSEWWNEVRFPLLYSPNLHKKQYAFFGHYWLDAEMKVIEATKFLSCLDSCCCVGEKLTAYRFPEDYMVQVDSEYNFEEHQ